MICAPGCSATCRCCAGKRFRSRCLTTGVRVTAAFNTSLMPSSAAPPPCFRVCLWSLKDCSPPVAWLASRQRLRFVTPRPGIGARPADAAAGGVHQHRSDARRLHHPLRPALDARPAAAGGRRRAVRAERLSVLQYGDLRGPRDDVDGRVSVDARHGAERLVRPGDRKERHLHGRRTCRWSVTALARSPRAPRRRRRRQRPRHRARPRQARSRARPRRRPRSATARISCAPIPSPTSCGCRPAVRRTSSLSR